MRDFSAIRIKIARVADRQYGHVTRQQLLELDLPSQTIARWLENGRLTTVHAAVYAVGHAQHSPQALAMAAVLACGDQAVLSHDSAAALWGIRTWPSRPEVTAPKERRRPGIHTHRTTTLTHKDIRRRSNIRVTSASRTILDIAPRLTDKQLTRAINELRLSKHLGAAELARLLTASPRAQRLIDPTQKPTRSGLEDRFAVFCREYGLPEPMPNTTPFGRESDYLFPEEKVIVEVDDWGTHKSYASFEADRERDATAAAHGFLTVRVTPKRLDTDPDSEAERLRQILEHRRPQAA